MTDVTTALVLPGGGVRGAYEVGVIAGMVEALGLEASDRSPFKIFTGASVGAINAAFLAANCHRGDLNFRSLIELWSSLHLDVYIKPRIPRRFLRHPHRFGGSLLEPGPMERLVQDNISWSQLRANAESGDLGALIITALDVASGQTTMFSEVGCGFEFRPSRDPMRTSRDVTMTAQHILASAALPMLFPSRRIDGRLYIDGGLRFNTPIAPAIRAGAERLIIVPTLFHRPNPSDIVSDPSPIFMAGKLLNSLIADRVDRDLQVLANFNQLLAFLDEVISPEERKQFDAVVTASRGIPYKQLETLIIRPSEDIGQIAGDHIRQRVRGPIGWILRKALERSGSREADWGSYMLFDGAFAEKLIDVGRRDALAMKAELKDFLAPGS